MSAANNLMLKGWFSYSQRRDVSRIGGPSRAEGLASALFGRSADKSTPEESFRGSWEILVEFLERSQQVDRNSSKGKKLIQAP